MRLPMENTSQIVMTSIETPLPRKPPVHPDMTYNQRPSVNSTGGYQQIHMRKMENMNGGDLDDFGLVKSNGHSSAASLPIDGSNSKTSRGSNVVLNTPKSPRKARFFSRDPVELRRLEGKLELMSPTAERTSLNFEGFKTAQSQRPRYNRVASLSNNSSDLRKFNKKNGANDAALTSNGTPSDQENSFFSKFSNEESLEKFKSECKRRRPVLSKTEPEDSEFMADGFKKSGAPKMIARKSCFTESRATLAKSKSLGDLNAESDEIYQCHAPAFLMTSATYVQQPPSKNDYLWDESPGNKYLHINGEPRKGLREKVGSESLSKFDAQKKHGRKSHFSSNLIEMRSIESRYNSTYENMGASLDLEKNRRVEGQNGRKSCFSSDCKDLQSRSKRKEINQQNNESKDDTDMFFSKFSSNAVFEKIQSGNRLPRKTALTKENQISSSLSSEGGDLLCDGFKRSIVKRDAKKSSPISLAGHNKNEKSRPPDYLMTALQQRGQPGRSISVGRLNLTPTTTLSRLGAESEVLNE